MLFDGLGRTLAYPWRNGENVNPFDVSVPCRRDAMVFPAVQVKHDDMSSKVFGWVDFFVFVLLTFALGFATNAKMYALLLDSVVKGGPNCCNQDMQMPGFFL